MNNTKKIGSVLEGLYNKRVDEKSDVQTDPKQYKKYIADTFGEALIAGDGTNALYDKGMEHVKKLAKMLKINPKQAMQDVISMCANEGKLDVVAEVSDYDFEEELDALDSLIDKKTVELKKIKKELISLNSKRDKLISSVSESSINENSKMYSMLLGTSHLIEESLGDFTNMVDKFKGDPSVKNTLPLVGDCKRRCNEILDLIKQIKEELG